MRIEYPDEYFDKKMKIFFLDGHSRIGVIEGYSFDYDDDGNIFSEVTFRREDGQRIEVEDRELASIEVLDDVSEDTAD
ncbi:MAG: hypothetical protein LUH59_03150 [Firmicutes bacterium]|nr:hypothetical protein [Bacillota bacterium]MCD7787909.1 hypothetical protein [Bacillota bacterium]